MNLEPVFPDSKQFKCEDLYLLTVGTEAGKEILETCHEIAHMLVKRILLMAIQPLNPYVYFQKRDQESNSMFVSMIS